MKKIEILPSVTQIKAHHSTSKGNEQFVLHIHNNYEIYLSMSNNNKFFVGQKIYDVNCRDLFLFNTTDVHKISTSDPEHYERYVVSFSPEVFQEDAATRALLSCFDDGHPDRRHKLSLSEEQTQRYLAIIEQMCAPNVTTPP